MSLQKDKMAILAVKLTDGSVQITNDSTGVVRTIAKGEKWSVNYSADYATLYYYDDPQVMLYADPALNSDGNSIFGQTTLAGLTAGIISGAIESSSGGGGGGTATSPADIGTGIDLSTDVDLMVTRLTEIRNELINSKSIADLLVQDSAGNNYVRQEVYNDTSATSVVTLRNLDGTPALPTPVPPLRPIKTIDYEVIQNSYTALAASTGVSIGQQVVIAQIINPETSVFVGQMYYNADTQAVVPLVPSANLKAMEDESVEILKGIWNTRNNYGVQQFRAVTNDLVNDYWRVGEIILLNFTEQSGVVVSNFSNRTRTGMPALAVGAVGAPDYYTDLEPIEQEQVLGQAFLPVFLATPQATSISPTYRVTGGTSFQPKVVVTPTNDTDIWVHLLTKDGDGVYRKAADSEYASALANTGLVLDFPVLPCGKDGDFRIEVEDSSSTGTPSCSVSYTSFQDQATGALAISQYEVDSTKKTTSKGYYQNGLLVTASDLGVNPNTPPNIYAGESLVFGANSTVISTTYGSTFNAVTRFPDRAGISFTAQVDTPVQPATSLTIFVEELGSLSVWQAIAEHTLTAFTPSWNSQIFSMKRGLVRLRVVNNTPISNGLRFNAVSHVLAGDGALVTSELAQARDSALVVTLREPVSVPASAAGDIIPAGQTSPIAGGNAQLVTIDVNSRPIDINVAKNDGVSDSDTIRTVEADDSTVITRLTEIRDKATTSDASLVSLKKVGYQFDFDYILENDVVGAGLKGDHIFFSDFFDVDFNYIGSRANNCENFTVIAPAVRNALSPSDLRSGKKTVILGEYRTTPLNLTVDKDLNNLQITNEGRLKTSTTIVDGTNTATIKGASGKAVVADSSIVVQASPNTYYDTYTDYQATTATAGVFVQDIIRRFTRLDTDGVNLDYTNLNMRSGVSISDTSLLASTPIELKERNFTSSLAGFQKITDGTNTASVKPASTTAAGTDPALVVTQSPNSPEFTSLNPSVVGTRAVVGAGRYMLTPPTLTDLQQIAVRVNSKGAAVVAQENSPTTLVGQVNPTADTALTAGKKVYRVALTNTSGAVVFLQFHQSAVALVTGNVPVSGMIYRVPANSTFVLDSTTFGSDGELISANTRIGLSSTFGTYTAVVAGTLAACSLNTKIEA